MGSGRKAVDRTRKREERRVRAQAGVPDPRQVDASIVHGLALALHVGRGRCSRAGEAPVRKAFLTAWVLRAAMRDLVHKTSLGRPLDRSACAAAIRDRLTLHDADASVVAPELPPRSVTLPQSDPAEFDEAMQALIALARQI